MHICSTYWDKAAHGRPAHRQDRETERMRLTTAQLILAMSRVAHRGTIVLLQHKLDTWTPARIVYALSKFADIHIFKPERKHASRSSFYTVARNINTSSANFKTFLKRCQDDWYEATFGGKNGIGQYTDGEDEAVCITQKYLLNSFTNSVFRRSLTC